MSYTKLRYRIQGESTAPVPPEGYKSANPFIHNATISYGLGTPAATAADLVKFDVIVGLKEASYDAMRASVKALDTSVKFLYYWNLNNVTSGDELDTLIEAEADPELYFPHAYDTVTQTIGSTPFTRNPGQRLFSYGTSSGNISGEDGNRWFVDYTSPSNRAFLAGNMPSLPSDMDGFFIDNWAPCGSNTGTITSGTASFIDGDVIGPTNIQTDNQWLEIHQKNLCIALVAAVYPASIVSINTATYSPKNAGDATRWRDYYDSGTIINGVTLTYDTCKTLFESRGVMEEFLYRVTNLYSTVEGYYRVNYEAFMACADPSKYCHIASCSNTSVTEIPANSDRMKLTLLAVHLLFQFDRSYFMYQAYNSQPLNCYYGAMLAQIGNPTDTNWNTTRVSLDSHTYRRTFSNGVAINRFRTSSGDNYTDSDTYSLGDTYYIVNADGTYGAQVSSVTLANSQGFIGVKNI